MKQNKKNERYIGWRMKRGHGEEKERKEVRRRLPKPSVAPLSLLRAN